jgi:hypothetical protein
MEEPLLSGASLVAELNRLERSSQQSQGLENYQDAFAWTVACIKARCSWPLLAPAGITVHHKDGGGLEFELDKFVEDEDSLQEDGVIGRHPANLFLA